MFGFGVSFDRINITRTVYVMYHKSFNEISQFENEKAESIK